MLPAAAKPAILSPFVAQACKGCLWYMAAEHQVKAIAMLLAGRQTARQASSY